MGVADDRRHRLTVRTTDSNELVIDLSVQAACDLGWDTCEDLQVTVVGLSGPPSQRALILHSSKNLEVALYRHKATMMRHAGLRPQ